jgi:hypothetical protein
MVKGEGDEEHDHERMGKIRITRTFLIEFQLVAFEANTTMS